MGKKEKDYTEIICIIDRSGSMASIKDDAIGSFNTFLKTQKKLPGKATLTYVQFNTEYEVMYENMPLKDVPELNSNTFIPRGCTALLDAVGRTIDTVDRRIKNIPKKKRPVVIVCILTDGEENSSTEFKTNQIKTLITNKENKHQWEFIFLTANQAAFSEAVKMGIESCYTVSFQATASGTSYAHGCMGTLVSNYRTK